MELNKPTTGTERNVVNPEGSIVRKRKPEIQLYLEASGLKIKSDSFYKDAPDKLKGVLDKVTKLNADYVLGLSKFLVDNGLKLSPVVLLSALSNEGFSFAGKEKDILKVFNTPQRVAEAISIQNVINNIKLNNSFKKKVLKVALEGMSEFTLRKNKMLKRKVKTKDLIKLLRPLPKDGEMARLYQAIIEDGPMSKFKEKESLVAVKSSTEMTIEEKKKYYEDNIDKIPVNMLIRNLKFIVENFDFSREVELEKRIIKRLNSINNYRFLNIFDVITTAMYVPQLEKPLFEVVKRFANNVKEKFNYNEDAVVLFDVSGSMDGKPLENGFKYLVLLSLIFNDVQLRMFSDSLFDKDLNGQIKDIKKGMISRAYKDFNDYAQHFMGGTSLLSSTRELVKQHEEKNIVIISDEVTWREGDDLRGEIDDISDLTKDRNVILVNPEVYQGTVFKNNLVAMASLTSAIVYNLMILTNQDEFVKYIKDY